MRPYRKSATSKRRYSNLHDSQNGPGGEQSRSGVEWLDFTAGASVTFLLGFTTEALFGEPMLGLGVAFPLIWIAQRTESRWGNPA